MPWLKQAAWVSGCRRGKGLRARMALPSAEVFLEEQQELNGARENLPQGIQTEPQKVPWGCEAQDPLHAVTSPSRGGGRRLVSGIPGQLGLVPHTVVGLEGDLELVL